jgi:hypothetical protein
MIGPFCLPRQQQINYFRSLSLSLTQPAPHHLLPLILSRTLRTALGALQVVHNFYIILLCVYVTTFTKVTKEGEGLDEATVVTVR